MAQTRLKDLAVGDKFYFRDGLDSQNIVHEVVEQHGIRALVRGLIWDRLNPLQTVGGDTEVEKIPQEQTTETR
jgi:hypothetical protein